MPQSLLVTVGQYSTKGRKSVNQDFFGACLPQEPQRSTKGVCVAVADGISSSDVSHIASESAVSGFFADYYCTSEAWSVKTSALRVLGALNSWLFSQTQRSQFRYDQERGYVCTFSAMVIKDATAHIFHAGDTRVYRLQGSLLEQLTTDHRLKLSEDTTYLSRAMGASARLDMEYREIPISVGDIFILATDGVYEFVRTEHLLGVAQQLGVRPADEIARALVETAYAAGSDDNLTLQIVHVEQLPEASVFSLQQQWQSLPLPPALEPRMEFDGYKIIRSIYTSSRSHVFLAVDVATQTQVVLKIPSTELQGDKVFLEHFLMEEWIGRRINNVHVVRPFAPERPRSFLYLVSEFIEGRTLTQWMIDHPQPDLETVRGIVEQIARGLRAFHRQEMLHQDLRPENILIDKIGTVKIIDFGSVRVAGIAEIRGIALQNAIPGTAQYTAPEYFLGEAGSPASDLFSLGVITYQMLSGRLPYGVEVAKSRTRAAQKKLVYQSVLDDEREIPVWLDHTLKKAVHIDRYKRYSELSEFLYDLRNPGKAFLSATRPPLMERNPLMFWQGLCCALTVVIVLLLAKLLG